MNKDFLWGAATSAAQIEGGVFDDGRGLSIWDAFCRIPGNVKNGDTLDKACDSYRRWKDDVRLLKELGVNSYRFSVSWPRVMPEGKGMVNQKGLDYYKRLSDALADNGIAPNITLYHWDLPYALHRLGGWLNRDIADMFADYADVVFNGIQSAAMFSTFNEPIAVYVGYAHKGFAPGFGLESYGRIANHNLLLSHGKAVERFRNSGNRAKIGIVVDVWNRVPLDANDPRDVELAAEQNALAHGSYLRPIFSGRYDRRVSRHLERERIDIGMQDGDMRLMSAPLDFFGLNCYNRVVVSSAGKDVKRALQQNGSVFFDNGEEFYPDAVYDAVKSVCLEYGVNVPIYVTENGIGFECEREENGVINDDERIKYLSGGLQSVLRADKEGYDVRGYYVWSLMDNFEWSAGYSMKFGLFTRERKPKKSAEFYRGIIRGYKERQNDQKR